MKMRVKLKLFLLLITFNTVIFANKASSPLGIMPLPEDGQPLSITSDSFHFDNQTGIATYTGNVIAKQGDRGLTGDKLEIHRNAQTGKIDKVIVQGKPAYYHGATEPNEPPVQAKADTIVYLSATKYLTLTGNAEVEQAGDVYRAWQIEYDGIKDSVYSPPSSTQRTVIILKDDGDVKL